MAEISDDLIDENSALKKRIAELEKFVSDSQKPIVRYEDRWLPRLTPILTFLGLIQTIFIAAGVGFGIIGVTNIMSVKNELDKIKDYSRDAERMNSQAKIEYNAQLDSLRTAQQTSRNIIDAANSTKQSISNTYTEVTSSQRIFESKLKSILKQTQQEQENLKLSVDGELSILRKKISTTDSNVINLAKVFSRAAVRGKNSGSLNASQAAFLFFLSSVLYETSGLPVDNEGLFYYNLAINLMSIGKFDLAIAAFNESLQRQPKLSDDKKSQIGKHIAICQNKVGEEKRMMSRQTKPLTSLNDHIDFNNRLSLSILQALTEVGIFEQAKADEVLKRAELDNN